MSTRYLVLAGGLVGLCVITLGILTRGEGLTIPRAERRALTGAQAAVHQELERLESAVPVGRSRDDGLWRSYLAIVEQEIAQGHIDVAVRVWQDAYGAALESQSWESMIAAGDAFMAIGRASGSVRGARLNAREAYLAALIRARRGRSVDGVLRSAEAFRGLGDGAVAEQCLRIAAQLAAGDEPAQRRVQRGCGARHGSRAPSGRDADGAARRGRLDRVPRRSLLDDARIARTRPAGRRRAVLDARCHPRLRRRARSHRGLERGGHRSERGEPVRLRHRRSGFFSWESSPSVEAWPARASFNDWRSPCCRCFRRRSSVRSWRSSSAGW